MGRLVPKVRSIWLPEERAGVLDRAWEVFPPSPPDHVRTRADTLRAPWGGLHQRGGGGVGQCHCTQGNIATLPHQLQDLLIYVLPEKKTETINNGWKFK